MEELSRISATLMEKLLTPCTDQSLRFNADHLLKERLAVISLITTFVQKNIDLTTYMIDQAREEAKPIMDRLQEQDEKLAKELRSRIKSL